MQPGPRVYSQASRIQAAFLSPLIPWVKHCIHSLLITPTYLSISLSVTFKPSAPVTPCSSNTQVLIPTSLPMHVRSLVLEHHPPTPSHFVPSTSNMLFKSQLQGLFTDSALVEVTLRCAPRTLRPHAHLSHEDGISSQCPRPWTTARPFDLCFCLQSYPFYLSICCQSGLRHTCNP